MNKPEFCWINPAELAEIPERNLHRRPADLQLFFRPCVGDEKWRFTYNEAGEVIRLERVEE